MDSLLLIPDISGFTDFVNRTEVEHSSHIVSELLELIIDSDRLGLTVAEIEGDAVLFYRKDEVPDFEDLLRQIEATFVRFHAHLRAYEAYRICRCGACSTAASLTLKFVAHRGPLDWIRVKDFQKPYGPGVILAHRLLKNDIPEREYLLVTESFFGDAGPENPWPDWVSFKKGSATYDLGPVMFRYAGLLGLLERVPTPDPAPSFQPVAHPIVVTERIDRPIEDVYDLVSSLDRRSSWNVEADEILFAAKRVNRQGTRHRCLIDGRPIAFETISADFGPNALVFGERTRDVPFVGEMEVLYILEPAGQATDVRLEIHTRPHPFPRSVLGWLFRLTAPRRFRTGLERIKRIAEAEQASGPA